MTEVDKRKAVPTPWPHCGPTLKSTLLSDLSDPPPICAQCPAAWWYETNDRFECFCTKFRATVFDKSNGPVTMCDAREEAIKEAPPQEK